MNDPLCIASCFALESVNLGPVSTLDIILHGSVPPFSLIELTLNYGGAYWSSPTIRACLSAEAQAQADAFHSLPSD